MRAAWLAACALLVACAPERPAESPSVAAPHAATQPGAPPPVTIDGALARTPGDGSTLVRVSVVRAHPLGRRIEPFLRAWPGWGKTLASITPRPLDDLEWIDVVGPPDPARERMLLRTVAPDEAIDARLRARADGSLRAVTRPLPHVVAAVPADAAQATEAALQGGRLVEPGASDDEALVVEMPEPHRVTSLVPAEVRLAVLRAFARPGGAGEALVELTCDDEATAARLADVLRERADRVNGVVVRLLTQDLLGGLKIASEGRVVRLGLPATREQLESLATLAQGLLPPSSSD